jgi:hypothetical protein
MADGFMLPFTGPTSDTVKADPSSDAQRALLVWADGRETIHLKSSYSGPASDFAWVIPIPSLPVVRRSDWTLFDQAERATRPQLTVITGYRFGLKGLSIGCSSRASEPQKQTPPTVVRVLQSLDIRELHIDIVTAADSGGFIQWLRHHHYAVPQKAEPILQRYIDTQFYFVVVKIGKSDSWPEGRAITQTVSGGLTPLAITFTAEKPFYPLAVSAISAAPENELLLLTVARLPLEPVEYLFDFLTYDNIERTVVPQLLENKIASLAASVDFTPAVRAALEQAPSPALIMESAVPMAWRGTRHSMLIAPRSVYAGERVVITRFHTFLKPHQMKDITFVPTKRALFQANFYIDLTDPRYHESAAAASAGLIILAPIVAAAANCTHSRKATLRKLALILMLLGLALI